jgi:hypothetical protein
MMRRFCLKARIRPDGIFGNDTFVADLFKSHSRLEAENLFLRYQLNLALRQKPSRIRLRDSDRAHYNRTRTHLALNKDCPLERPIQSFGSVASIPVLAGLHHQYARI